MADSHNNSALRLFLSADLAGSTAFKQSGKLDEWQKHFREFYRQLPALVDWRLADTGPQGLLLPVWKLIGDEIVFTTKLTRWEQAAAAVHIFRSAVTEYRRGIVAGTEGRLDVKCAGWTAGFPVGNIVVAPLQNQLPEDYIGPGMDIGFRLVKAASPRRMFLSVELAWLLTLPQHRKGLRIHLSRGLDLKGVAKGRTYPCIWLDNFRDAPKRSDADELDLREEKLRGGVSRCCKAPDLHAFCRHWLENMGPPFLVPFIKGDRAIGRKPAGYDELYSKVTTEEKQGPDVGREPKAGDAPLAGEDILSQFQKTIRQARTRKR